MIHRTPDDALETFTFSASITAIFIIAIIAGAIAFYWGMA
jgi:hypothetical protein